MSVKHDLPDNILAKADFLSVTYMEVGTYQTIILTISGSYPFLLLPGPSFIPVQALGSVTLAMLLVIGRYLLLEESSVLTR